MQDQVAVNEESCQESCQLVVNRDNTSRSPEQPGPRKTAIKPHVSNFAFVTCGKIRRKVTVVCDHM